jgi:hypothetical protein
MRRLILVACVAAVAALGGAQAAAASGWAIQPVDPPSGGGLFNGVSCPSAQACVAVGRTNGPLAEAWNGTSWKLASVPTPAGSVGSELDGVSCASARNCEAVGFNNLPSTGPVVNGDPLAEHWNGTSWSVQSVPVPTGAPNYTTFFGVSCPSERFCVAVGAFGALATWNGAAWSTQIINPDEDLDGVSCSSPTACTAVGEYGFLTSGLVGPVVLRFNGTSWSTQSTPDNSSFQAVSCPTATACTATGVIGKLGSGYINVAEHWNGTTWSIQRGPTLPNLYQVNLGGVSCASATSCTAAGWYAKSGDDAFPLVEGWNRSTWSVQSTPAPGSGYSYFRGVSCASAEVCTAVGYGNFNDNGPFVEHKSGSSTSHATKLHTKMAS